MSMSLDAAKRKEMWLSLCNIVDNAVIVAEQEEEEEEINKIKYTKKTMSSQDIDNNRSRKGKSKIVYEEEDEEEESEERLLKKAMKISASTSRRCPQQILENLNGASTSTSVPNLTRYNTSESEKTETKTPPNPSYQSSQSSRKKAKVAPLPQIVSREIPEWLIQRMRDMDGAQDLRLIFGTGLTESDVHPLQSRLLIPFYKLFRNDFLTPAETRAIWRLAVTKEEKDNTGLGTILVSQMSKKWGMRFKIWAMKKSSGDGTLNYAFNWDWNGFVDLNDLKAGDKIRLWTFRWNGFLCFALDTE